MAAKSGRTRPAVIDQLIAEPYRFEFFQAVRLLLRSVGVGQLPLPLDISPEQDPLRAHVIQSHCFPSAEIVRIERRPPDPRQPNRPQRLEMYVTMMGLTGPSGVLPRHYTSLIIDRVREKDTSLAEFLDVFNHRTISLFYRAWEKYRFPISFERQRPIREQGRGGDDLFTFCLHCLIGLGADGLRGRQSLDDDTLLYYGGLFAQTTRNVLSLERMIVDHFGLPLEIIQFRGQWLQLATDDQSSLPGKQDPRGFNCALGVNAVAGERVWDVQSGFRQRVGPLSYVDFCRLMPSGDMLRPWCEITRTYVGPQFDFDVQPVLRKEEIPWCQLGGDGPSPARLGWNTWIRSGDMSHDADDVVFRLESI